MPDAFPEPSVGCSCEEVPCDHFPSGAPKQPNCSAASIYDRARTWRERWKYEDGSILAIHLREPEEIIDGLLEEAERMRRVVDALDLRELLAGGYVAAYGATPRG